MRIRLALEIAFFQTILRSLIISPGDFDFETMIALFADLSKCDKTSPLPEMKRNHFANR